VKISSFRRMIPAVAAAGLLTLGTLATPAVALAAPGSGTGTGGGNAGGDNGFSVNSQGTISADNDDSQGPTTRNYYPNCAAVRAAGKAPLYSSQPGYSALLDPQGTGVACGPGTTTP